MTDPEITPAPVGRLLAAGRRWVVEVNEAKVHFTGAGSGSWELFRLRQPGRITDIPGWVPGGTLALVSSVDQVDAEWLAGHLVDGGLPRTAVRVRVLPVMTPAGAPGCCLHPVAEYVSLNSRPAARCRSCGLVEPVR